MAAVNASLGVINTYDLVMQQKKNFDLLNGNYYQNKKGYESWDKFYTSANLGGALLSLPSVLSATARGIGTFGISLAKFTKNPNYLGSFASEFQSSVKNFIVEGSNVNPNSPGGGGSYIINAISEVENALNNPALNAVSPLNGYQIPSTILNSATQEFRLFANSIKSGNLTPFNSAGYLGGQVGVNAASEVLTLTKSSPVSISSIAQQLGVDAILNSLQQEGFAYGIGSEYINYPIKQVVKAIETDISISNLANTTVFADRLLKGVYLKTDILEGEVIESNGLWNTEKLKLIKPHFLILENPSNGTNKLFSASLKGVTDVAIKINSQSNCSECKRLGEVSCILIKDIREKVLPIDQFVATNKLCENLVPTSYINNPLKLNAIKALTPTELNIFLNDIKILLDGSSSFTKHIALQSNIPLLSATVIDGWKKLNTIKSANFRRDIDADKKVGEAYNGNLPSKVGGATGLDAIITANKGLQCSTCTYKSNAYMPYIDKYLEYVEKFANKFSDVPTAAGIFADLKTNNYRMVIGASFQVRVLAESNLIPATAAFDGSIEDGQGDDNADDEIEDNDKPSKCRFDIRVGTGAAANYYEFKSWGISTVNKFIAQPSKRVQFTNQFKVYLGKVSDFNNLHYYFDNTRGVPVTETNHKIKQMFKKIYEGPINANGTPSYDFHTFIKSKPWLDLKFEQMVDFKAAVDNFNSDLYKFINMK